MGSLNSILPGNYRRKMEISTGSGYSFPLFPLLIDELNGYPTRALRLARRNHFPGYTKPVESKVDVLARGTLVSYSVYE